MMTSRSRIACLLTLLTTAAWGAGQEYQSLDSFLARLAPDPVLQVVEGDLNGDGRSDRAVVTHESNGAITPKLYVLLQTPNGGFTQASRTEVPRVHSGSVELAIQRGSLYVHLESIKPGNGHVTHQFKLYRGAWRLIGSTRVNPLPASTAPEDGVNFMTTNTNRLTGEVIESTTHSKKTTRRRVPTRAPCLLEGYDFDLDFCG